MRARKADGNQAALRSMWRAIGGSWLTISPEHGGEPDALVGWRGRDALVEVKDGSKPPSERKLRPNQVEWHRTWQGRPVEVVLCFDDLKELFEDS